MYLPAHFAETDPARLQALMRAQPLATLLRHGAGGLDADHLPCLVDAEPGPLGRLRAHVARANPLWRETDGAPVLAIFHGPDAYVTPSWYPSKREHGRAVPTWNYAVVHAHGRLRVVDDRDWLRTQVTELTRLQETAFAPPWSPADAPPDYLDQMLAAIVGIEIVVERLVGKWKTSQNQAPANRDGVASALESSPDPRQREMAGLVRGGKR